MVDVAHRVYLTGCNSNYLAASREDREVVWVGRDGDNLTVHTLLFPRQTQSVWEGLVRRRDASSAQKMGVYSWNSRHLLQLNIFSHSGSKTSVEQ